MIEYSSSAKESGMNALDNFESLFILYKIILSKFVFPIPRGPFIKKFCKENNLNLKIIKKQVFQIPAMFKFHKKPKKKINIVILRITK